MELFHVCWQWVGSPIWVLTAQVYLSPSLCFCRSSHSWPCIFQWMEARRQSPTCPVCKSVIDKERLIPLYGRGNSSGADPRYTDSITPFVVYSLCHAPHEVSVPFWAVTLSVVALSVVGCQLWLIADSFSVNLWKILVPTHRCV